MPFRIFVLRMLGNNNPRLGDEYLKYLNPSSKLPNLQVAFVSCHLRSSFGPAPGLPMFSFHRPHCSAFIELPDTHWRRIDTSSPSCCGDLLQVAGIYHHEPLRRLSVSLLALRTYLLCLSMHPVNLVLSGICRGASTSAVPLW